MVDRDGGTRNGKVLQVMGYLGLERLDVEEAEAGDIPAASEAARRAADLLLTEKQPDKALGIAADICIYTNHNLTLEELDAEA